MLKLKAREIYCAVTAAFLASQRVNLSQKAEAEGLQDTLWAVTGALRILLRIIQDTKLKPKAREIFCNVTAAVQVF